MANDNNPALYYFHQGTNYESFRYFGLHFDGGQAVFRVWAPHAVSVSVVGDFNNWDKTINPMHRLNDGGVWECFVYDVHEYQAYKYSIETKDGRTLLKTDPFAVHCETPPGTASKVYDISGYEWHDQKWQNRYVTNLFESPMNIYEVHLGSWKRHPDGNVYSYAELAKDLSDYVTEMGYTHVEFLPVSEYPFDGSWGYQVTGYFAPTSRFGTPKDFMYLVDVLHQHGIGVILDWVPAHFPKDAHGLYEFDGTICYEDANPYRREHKSWGTRIFDYGKPEIQSFLISSAINWLENYHIDGLRVDAVASMLYLDYDRKDGEWSPNSRGGRENLEAIAFLQKLNEQVYAHSPHAIMAAEESTAWPMVTKPVSMGGLGFNFKWNMGWMNDTLSYNQTDPYFRKGIHNKLTFSMMYAYSENYILPISHDEVVHGKRSMIGKMPGDYEMQFANLRTFYAYMFAHPGKKLIFMGNELAQFIEWRYNEQLDWLLFDFEKHKLFHEFMKKLNWLYKMESPFWDLDDTWDGFRWINADDSAQNVLSFLRLDRLGNGIACVFNFAPVDRAEYRIGVPNPGVYHLIMDTSDSNYGGSNHALEESFKAERTECNGFPYSIKVHLAPMAALYIAIPKRKKRGKSE